MALLFLNLPFSFTDFRLEQLFKRATFPRYATWRKIYDANPILKRYSHTGPPWMSPFNIVELIIHRKYHMMGQDSKVG